MAADPLKALFHPFETGALPAPPPEARALFINGRVCPGLSSWPRGAVTVQQYFKPWADEAARAGFKTVAEIPESAFDMVLLLAPRQHDEALHAMATALHVLKPGGIFVCAAANDEGGKRLKKDAKYLGFSCTEESKHKSRVVWRKKETIDEPRCAAAREDGGYRKVCGARYISRPGVFSWDKVDTGSTLLADSLPAGALKGRGADFGCGFGFLSIHALKHNPAITEIFCIDADARAVESCRRNMPDIKSVQFIWEDITRGNRNLPQNLDWIVMNPPFHEGGRALPETGMAFIKTARECLRPGGGLWMVANAHLPYEKTLQENFSSLEKVCEKNGYKIFRAA